MLQVPTYVDKSAIAGLGLFAKRDIQEGEIVWRFDEGFEKLFDTTLLPQLPEHTQQFIEEYGYPYSENERLMVMEIDNGRFMNHSDKPNLEFGAPREGIALRDIKAGEELTCSYRQFHPKHKLFDGVVA